MVTVGNSVRLAGAVEVPEPSAIALTLISLATGGHLAWRRRRRVDKLRLSSPAIRLAAVVTLLATNLAGATPITVEWVTVGDSGNMADIAPTGYGAVTDVFRLMKYEMTNSDYTIFLNAVAKTDPYFLYNPEMSTDVQGGITRTGTPGDYIYAVKPNMASKPVTYVSWFDAARMANWMHNGATGFSSTETGAYTLAGATSGAAPQANAFASFYVPSEDQWYKAAYYRGGGTNAGYYDYATQSDASPTPATADGAGNGSAGSVGNFANFNAAAQWNGDNFGGVTSVGTNGGPGAYGTFDMSGNVYEWNDLSGAAGLERGVRGGGWNINATYLSSSVSGTHLASFEGNLVGFRLAAVPEPSTCATMTVAGLAGTLHLALDW